MTRSVSSHVPTLNAVSIIKRRVAGAFGIPVEKIDGQQRHRSVTVPRQTAMWLAYRVTGHSTTVLGNLFGGRDHTTVMHAIAKTEDRLQSDDRYRAVVERLLAESRQEYDLDDRVTALIERIGDKARDGIVERLSELAARSPRDLAADLAPELFRTGTNPRAGANGASPEKD